MPKTRRRRGKLRRLNWLDRAKTKTHNQRTNHSLKKWEKRHVKARG